MRTGGFILAVASLALLTSLVLHDGTSTATQIEPGDLTVCPEADAWAMSVWTGPNGMPMREAIEACPLVPIVAAYWLNPTTQTWLSFDRNAPDALNSLTVVDNLMPLFLRGEATDQTREIEAYDDYFEYQGEVNPQVPVAAGIDFTIVLRNEGNADHNIRISGPDRKFYTNDDLISVPAEIEGGSQGTVQGNIGQPGSYPFWCDFHIFEQMRGTLVVQ